jgi:hypothetical protein
VHGGVDKALGKIKIIGSVKNEINQCKNGGPALWDDHGLAHEQQISAQNKRGQHHYKWWNIELVGANERREADRDQYVKRPLKETLSAARTGNGLACCEVETARGHYLIVPEFQAGAKRNPRADDRT